MELIFSQHAPKDDVEIRLCGTLLYCGPEDAWAAFCDASLGHIYREWLRKLYKMTPSLRAAKYDFKNSTQCLMLFRALCVTYLWAELELKRHSEPETILQKLFDEYIIDYTGKIGRQPYFYYLPRETHARQGVESHLQRLYGLALLFRLDIKVNNDETGRIYFKPPNVPVTSADEIGEALPLWDEILKNISKRQRNERIR